MNARTNFFRHFRIGFPSVKWFKIKFLLLAVFSLEYPFYNPVYDVTTNHILIPTNTYPQGAHGVPLFVEKCVEFIEREGLGSEGLYRVPGNRAHVDMLFNKFNEGKSSIFVLFLCCVVFLRRDL